LKFDKDGTKNLDKKEVKVLLNEMHIHVLEEWFEKTFAKYDKNHNNQLEYDEFKALMNELSFKKEVVPLFKEFCAKAVEGLENTEHFVMTGEELQKFYLKAQNQKMDIKNDINPLIDYYNDNDNKNKEQKDYNISFLTFCSILFSMDNQIFNTEKSKLTMVFPHFFFLFYFYFIFL